MNRCLLLLWLAAIFFPFIFADGCIATSGVLSAVPVVDLDPSQPVPLLLVHTPVSFTFAFFGESFVLDPSLAEEEVCDGRLTVVCNSQGEMCLAQMSGGLAVDADTLRACVAIAKDNTRERVDWARSQVAAQFKSQS